MIGDLMKRNAANRQSRSITNLPSVLLSGLNSFDEFYAKPWHDVDFYRMPKRSLMVIWYSVKAKMELDAPGDPDSPSNRSGVQIGITDKLQELDAIKAKLRLALTHKDECYGLESYDLIHFSRLVNVLNLVKLCLEGPMLSPSVARTPSLHSQLFTKRSLYYRLKMKYFSLTSPKPSELNSSDIIKDLKLCLDRISELERVLSSESLAN